MTTSSVPAPVYRHEMLSIEERELLWDRIVRLRKHLKLA